MYDVFISYSSDDEKQANSLVDTIEAAGIRCWIASRNILISSNFAAAIFQAISNSKVVVLLLSSSSNKSKYVKREISLAVDKNIPILPVALENVKLSGDMEFWLSIIERVGPMSDEKALYSKAVEWLSAFLNTQNSGSQPAVSQDKAKHSNDVKIDIYDADMEYVGSAFRKKVHSIGLWHKTFHCWIYRNDNGKGLIWVQRRSSSKSDFPSKLDITVGRHLLEGETDKEAVRRVSAEIGAEVPFSDLTYIGVRSHSEHVGSFINNEHNSVFLYNAPYSLSDLNPNPSEVSAVLQIDAAELLSLFKGRKRHITAYELSLDSGKNIRQSRISIKDFVPHDKEYYKEICMSVIKLCTGQ